MRIDRCLMSWQVKRKRDYVRPVPLSWDLRTWNSWEELESENVFEVIEDIHGI